MNFIDPSSLDLDTLLTLGVYVGLAGLYLVVVPAVLLFYLKQRWYVAGSLERLFIYGLVFVFFPGMLVLSPLLNFRPQRREV
ncbi:MAG: NAD(P)H-quinone oxidoreductase subunit L [Cyanobacteria bacterium P01_G01_bin.38]